MEVGTHIMINDQLPHGIWPFQKLYWNHERQSITDRQPKNFDLYNFEAFSGHAKKL